MTSGSKLNWDEALADGTLRKGNRVGKIKRGKGSKLMAPPTVRVSRSSWTLSRLTWQSVRLIEPLVDSAVTASFRTGCSTTKRPTPIHYAGGSQTGHRANLPASQELCLQVKAGR